VSAVFFLDVLYVVHLETVWHALWDGLSSLPPSPDCRCTGTPTCIERYFIVTSARCPTALGLATVQPSQLTGNCALSHTFGKRLTNAPTRIRTNPKTCLVLPLLLLDHSSFTFLFTFAFAGTTMGNAPLGTTYDAKQAKAIFAQLDRDGDGNLTINELQTGLEALSLVSEWPPEKVLRFIEKFDVNDDGVLDYDEFTKLIKHIIKRNKKKEDKQGGGGGGHSKKEQGRKQPAEFVEKKATAFGARGGSVRRASNAELQDMPESERLALHVQEAAAAEAAAFAAAEVAAKAAASGNLEVKDESTDGGTKFSSKQAKSIFGQLDADSTGTLNHEKVLAGVGELGITDDWDDSKLDKFVRKYNHGGGDLIDFLDFKSVCKHICKANRKTAAAAEAEIAAAAAVAAEAAAAEARVEVVEVDVAGGGGDGSNGLGTTYSPKVAQAIFHKLDEDSSGTLDIGELRRGINELGLAEGWSFDKLRKYIKKADDNGDGVLDFKEFKALCKGICKKNRKDAEAAAAEEAIKAAEVAATAAAAITEDNVEVLEDGETMGTKFSKSLAKLVFEKIDANHPGGPSGSLPYEQLIQGIYNLGLTTGWGWSHEKLLVEVEAVDVNQDRDLDVTEFMKLCKVVCQQNRDSLAERAAAYVEETRLAAEASAAAALVDDAESSEEVDAASAGLGIKFSSTKAQQIFNKIDNDNSGSLSRSELQDGIQELGLTDGWSHSQLKRFIVKFDSNDDGELDFTEFRELCKSVCKKNKLAFAREQKVKEAEAIVAAAEAEKQADMENVEEAEDVPESGLGIKYSSTEAKAIFNSLDADGSGGLSYTELAQGIVHLGLTTMTTPELVAFITDFDTNKDGELDITEFKGLCKGICKKNRSEIAISAAEDQAVAKVEAIQLAAAAEAEPEVAGPVEDPFDTTKYSASAAQEIFNKSVASNNSLFATQANILTMVLELGISRDWNEKKLKKAVAKYDKEANDMMDFAAFQSLCKAICKKNAKNAAEEAAQKEAAAAAAAEAAAASSAATADIEVQDDATTSGLVYDSKMTKQYYKQIDVQQTNAVDYEDLYAGLKKLGLVDGWKDAKINKFMERFDVNGDGVFDYDEFKSLCKAFVKWNRKVAAQKAVEIENLARAAAEEAAAAAAVDDIESSMPVLDESTVQYSAEEAQAAFNKHDAGAKTNLTTEEALQAIAELPIAKDWSVRKLTKAVIKSDANEDGVLDFGEFKSLCKGVCKKNKVDFAKKAKVAEAEALIAAEAAKIALEADDAQLEAPTLGTEYTSKAAKFIFKKIDADGSKSLSYDELAQGVTELGIASGWPESQLNKFIKQYDTDGDGELDLKEFKGLCKAICQLNRDHEAQEAAAAALTARRNAEAAAMAQEAQAQEARRQQIIQQNIIARTTGGAEVKEVQEITFAELPSTYQELTLLKDQNDAFRALRTASEFNPQQGKHGSVTGTMPEEDFSNLSEKIRARRARNSSSGN
jgi:Ca2+-binding EF-hand superfamily protein